MVKQIRLKEYAEIIETCANVWYSESDGGGVNCPCCRETYKSKDLYCHFGCEPSRTGIPKDCPLEDVPK
jgi:hypothetical protein